MELKIFSVYDEKAQVYRSPFYLKHKGEAMRSFSDLVNDDKTIINKHPEDYKLYYLGVFDDVSGKMGSRDTPEFICNASDFKVERS